MLTEWLLQRPALSNLLYPEQPQARALASSQAASPSSSSTLPSNSDKESRSSEAAFALSLSPSALALSRSRPALLGEVSKGSQSNATGSGAGLLNAEEETNTDGAAKPSTEGPSKASTDKTANSSTETSGEEALSEEDQRKVEKLEDIDRKVHVHEHTHLAAAGGYARGGAQFEYVSGPDGDRYAVAGHVNMDTGREHSPEATLRKAQTVRKAALAPADPSAADRQIAADMAQMAEEARSQIAEESKVAAEGAKAEATARSAKPDSSSSPQYSGSSSQEQDTATGSTASDSRHGEEPKASTSSTSQLRRDGVPWGAAAYQAASQSAYAQATGYVQAAASYENIALVA